MLNANGQFSLPCLSSLNDPPAWTTGRPLLLTRSPMAARTLSRWQQMGQIHKLKIALRKSNWHKSAFPKVHNFFCNWENLVKKLLKSKMPFWPISQATKVCCSCCCCCYCWNLLTLLFFIIGRLVRIETAGIICIGNFLRALFLLAKLAKLRMFA